LLKTSQQNNRHATIPTTRFPVCTSLSYHKATFISIRTADGE
jgi:hypothetical protein